MRSFRRRLVALAAFCCLVVGCLPYAGMAQPTAPQGLVNPADVTDAQLGVFKRGMELGCQNAGRSMGQPEDAVKGYCGCIVKALNDNLSQAIWRQAYVEDTLGHDNEVNRLLMDPNLDKIRACRGRQ